mgnify:CR=1 FL=1
MILGESGSGKTTLLHILGLMDESTEGEYLFEGIDTGSLSEREKAKLRNKKLGFVFQKYHLIKTMTTMENIELPLGYANCQLFFMALAFQPAILHTYNTACIRNQPFIMRNHNNCISLFMQRSKQFHNFRCCHTI